MGNYYGFLMEFTKGTTPCREHLVRRYGESVVDGAISSGYIMECGTNSWGDIKYTITSKGKKERDE